jgi:hypothetical protein
VPDHGATAAFSRLVGWATSAAIASAIELFRSAMIESAAPIGGDSHDAVAKRLAPLEGGTNEDAGQAPRRHSAIFWTLFFASPKSIRVFSR